jgi:hypothetical protein
MTAKKRKKQIAAIKVKILIASSVKLRNYKLENALKQCPSTVKNTLIRTNKNKLHFRQLAFQISSKILK